MKEITFHWFNDTSRPQQIYYNTTNLSDRLGVVGPHERKKFTVMMDNNQNILFKQWDNGLVLVWGFVEEDNHD